MSDVAEAVAAAWNRTWPTGSAVDVVRDNGDVCRTTTRSPAWVLDPGHVVVLITGIRGGYLLSRVVPIGSAGCCAEA